MSFMRSATPRTRPSEEMRSSLSRSAWSVKGAGPRLRRLRRKPTGASNSGREPLISNHTKSGGWAKRRERALAIRRQRLTRRVESAATAAYGTPRSPGGLMIDSLSGTITDLRGRPGARGHHAGEGYTRAVPQVRLHADLAAQGGARGSGREPGSPFGRGCLPARQAEKSAGGPRHRLPGARRAGGDRGNRGQALVRVPDALRPERGPAPGHPLFELRRGLRGAGRPLREPGGAHPGRHPLRGDAGLGGRRGPLPRLPHRGLNTPPPPSPSGRGSMTPRTAFTSPRDAFNLSGQGRPLGGARRSEGPLEERR